MPEPFDIFIIGGGINGCGIARDAAGRGLKVGLAEMNDLASATSSASTKLFHGGLRYLEFFEFRLVREALKEREVLLRAMPHISWPMRFVLPCDPEMRFEGGTPTSRLLSIFMPWARGRRPAWLIRLALFLYDHMGGRKILPGTTVLDLQNVPEGEPLIPRLKKAFEYSDCWIEDARLVVLNARDACERGAEVMTRTKVISARRDNDLWQVELDCGGERRSVQTRVLVNAAGPWVADVLGQVVGSNSSSGVRLVRGSHIVTRRLYDHDKCYFFQGPDGRIIFAIPYEQDFTLIGTTDADHPDAAQKPECSAEEQSYLIAFAGRYFKQPLTEADIVWTYSGVRPLYDDGAKSATAATRDYVLELDTSGPAMLSVFGGKITTYRKLAEAALSKITPVLDMPDDPWTAGVALPGGDFPVDGVEAQVRSLLERHPFLDLRWAQRLIRAYGTDAAVMLEGAETAADLGAEFGATITARELDWVIQKEWVRAAEDFLWRRTKLGLRLSKDEQAKVGTYIQANLPERVSPGS
ncbi:glycerol-3-phosphate dehydrogenase [Halovulum sp. GXIMD14793]